MKLVKSLQAVGYCKNCKESQIHYVLEKDNKKYFECVICKNITEDIFNRKE